MMSFSHKCINCKRIIEINSIQLYHDCPYCKKENPPLLEKYTEHVNNTPAIRIIQPLHTDRNSKVKTKALVVLVIVCSLFFTCAIPAWFRAQRSANESAMIKALRDISAAETDYYYNSVPRTYAGEFSSLATIIGAGVSFMDPNLASGLKNGYSFKVAGGEVNMSSDGPVIWTWSAAAWPVKYRRTGTISGYIDESGVIRGADLKGETGTVSMPAIK